MGLVRKALAQTSARPSLAEVKAQEVALQEAQEADSSTTPARKVSKLGANSMTPGAKGPPALSQSWSSGIVKLRTALVHRAQRKHPSACTGGAPTRFSGP